VSQYGSDYGEEILNNTGEQNQSLAGDAAFNDATRPNQTTNDPNSVSNTTDYGDYGSPTGVGAAGTSTTVPLDPYSGLTPAQLQALGNADPTDPIIRARLGIPQLPNSDLNNLPSTSNFFNSLTSVASSITPTIQKALSALTAKTPGTSPYAQSPVIPKSLSALTAKASTPTQDAYGLTILDAAQTAQITRNVNPAFINSLVDPNAGTKGIYVDAEGVAFDSATGLSLPVVNGKQVLPERVMIVTPLPELTGNRQPTTTSATPVYIPRTATDYRQTVAEAARQNANSEFPNPFLTQIDQAGAEIAKGEAGVATAKQTIQSAQQKITDSESIIAQNNTELANPDTTVERRAVLEANNAAQTQNIFDQTQSVTENQAYITNTQDTIQFNEATINENAAVYRDSTGPSNTTVVPINVDPNVTAVDTAATATAAVVNSTNTAVPVDPTTLEGYGVNEVGATRSIFGLNPDAEAEAASAAQVGRQLAQQQAVLTAQKKKANDQDWRVRLSLAPGANYLYNDAQSKNSILAPLAVTGGVIFPYTPKIEMSYKADYESYALTHSNYKGYFYKSSYVDTVGMTATFTAQDSAEAAYLLAVIHFFRSVTKMFYGQDRNPAAGSPPPLVFLTGLGQYQFATQPCLVTSFNYNLPNDVDYIRANSPNINGTNMLTRRDRQDLPTNPISGAVARLQQLWSSQRIMPGAGKLPPQVPSLAQGQPTYVPTRLEISISLLPVQTRSQVTNQFSLQRYASGALLGGGYNSERGGSLKGGFW
jgi:hypothetical protein